MSLERGARIAHYEILGLLGRGGMGEVYRATDTKLNRDVALKLLPEQFTTDADRMERFQREARVLASMNHSNIAAIYGLEESMPLRALVMELVAGSTLADRIARGPIPIDEVLFIAKQIAEAIEYAHERGIIHRDLKPANIKLTQEGQVKILDFGLAKAITDEVFYANPHDSPTLTAATEAGVVLGTASYMAPEQAKGRVVDRRADIWAFGVILYELLAGRMMFRADSAPETMALVLMSEPDWSALPADTPRALKQLLQRCLVKDPRSRMRDIGDARIAIEEIIASPKTEEPKPEASPRRSRALPWAVAVAITAITVASMWIALRRTNAPQPVTRLTTELGVDAVLTTGAGASAILSPDGRTLAFTAKPSGQTSQVFVRRLDQLQATPLPGTDGADEAFFSPNGQWLAFFANSKLNKTSLTGGSVITICDAEDPRGGTWLEDDSIVFAPNTRSGLMRVPAAGGKPEVLTKLAEGEISHRWPNALPGGDAILFSASASIGYENANLAVYSLRTKETKVLQHGGYYPQYSRSGHLLYIQQGNLFAVPFDADKLQLNGQPVPVLESVMSVVESGGAQYQIANNGALIYTPGRYTSPGFNLEWLTREGKIQSLRETTARYLNPRFSPDGSRLAFEIAAQQYNIWVYEWARDAMTRLTFDPLQDRRPVWTPDGRRIAFTSQRGNKVSFNLYWVRADGTSEPERLTDSTTNQIPTSWHPSGKFLAYYEARPDTRGDIMILPMEGDESSGWRPGKPTPFLQTPFTEAEPAFSPDGRWIAYLSDESGRGEVYVRPFPGPGGKWQISTAGGVLPTWSKNGKEIFFEALDKKIMVVNYTVEGESFHAGKPQVWSEATIASAGAVRDFDIHPDGQRFVILKSADSQAQKLDKVTFVFNFADELRKIAPVR